MMPRMSGSSRFAVRSTSTPLMSGIRMSEIEQVDPARLQSADRLAPVLGEQDLVALPAQAIRQQLPDRRFVVDEEETGWRLRLVQA